MPKDGWGSRKNRRHSRVGVDGHMAIVMGYLNAEKDQNP